MWLGEGREQRVSILRVGASGMGRQHREGREGTDQTCPEMGSMEGQTEDGRRGISSITN